MAVSGFDYQYDEAGQLDTATENSEIIDYCHDETGQLEDALRTVNPDEMYRYDDSGNRVTANGDAYAPAEHNRYESQGDYTFDYDDEGNLIEKTNTATGETWTYQFDHRNRLTTATQTDSVGSVLSKVNFVYDALDRRIGKLVTANSPQPTAHIFFYDGDHIWRERKTADSPLPTVYFLFGDRIDQLLARHRSDDGLAFYLTDRMGSVRAIADTDGSVLSQTDYSSFGEIISQTNPEKADQFGFTGREFDPETDLYYYRARYYDPGLGRFISEDPIGFGSSQANLTAYVNNNPLAFLDPSGNSAKEYFSVVTNSIQTSGRILGGFLKQCIPNILAEIGHSTVTDAFFRRIANLSDVQRGRYILGMAARGKFFFSIKAFFASSAGKGTIFKGPTPAARCFLLGLGIGGSVVAINQI